MGARSAWRLAFHRHRDPSDTGGEFGPSRRGRHEADRMGPAGRRGRLFVDPVGAAAEVDGSGREDSPKAHLGGTDGSGAAESVGANRLRDRTLDPDASPALLDEGFVLLGEAGDDESLGCLAPAWAARELAHPDPFSPVPRSGVAAAPEVARAGLDLSTARSRYLWNDSQAIRAAQEKAAESSVLRAKRRFRPRRPALTSGNRPRGRGGNAIVSECRMSTTARGYPVGIVAVRDCGERRAISRIGAS